MSGRPAGLFFFPTKTNFINGIKLVETGQAT